VQFRRRGHDLAAVFGREKRGEGGIYRGGDLGEGLGFGRHRFASDSSGLRHVRPGLVKDDV
jgi:hypothetical protein